ncbi:MAG: ribosome silencing factor [Chloroflexi bacterium]|nr:ribosome silencing factor [Chloroflexota bacterium]
MGGTTLDSLTFARSLVEAIEDKKGENIVLLDISGQSIFADYFVIATGASDRQLRALADGVNDAAENRIKRKVILRRLDEQAESGWVLIDLGGVIVHLFSAAQRKHYNLEELWKEGKILLRVQ